VTPWYTKPDGSEAAHLAAIERLKTAVAAIRCTLDLLSPGMEDPRERELLYAIELELRELESALTRITM
jgi:hypothetical protein